jgi:tetratricopeptide (TPR) repeat protein
MTRRKVMISSTAADLPEHRDEIRLGCERAGFEPCLMEHLPALDADAIKASLRMVHGADVYVGVFAYRYGYVPDGQDISITELEYNHAVELEKPRLIFLAHKDHPIKIGDVETGPGEARLNALKERLAKERVVTFFQSPKDLRAQVVEALSALGQELDAAATSGDLVASAAAKLHRKTSISVPPEPYIAHPYTLLQSRSLVGRQTELNLLTDWVARPGSSAFEATIFCFVAIGGMGKSALTWKWFNQIAPREMKPLAGRIWWSFYESDANFENFLKRALCYVSMQSEEEVRALPWQECETQLLRKLNERPYLVVLDGLERILIAYNRMDASRLADDEIDQQTANRVAGVFGLPTTAAQSFVGQHRLRQTTDPRAGAFLRKLAQVSGSRVLISSRLYPSDLQLPTLNPNPGCFALFLKGLTDDDAVGLWRGLGASGARAELLPIFRSVESHPLLIQALASEVAKYRVAPGNFAQWLIGHPEFVPASLPLVQSRTHILQFALTGISAQVRAVLSMVVGFRMPASYASLEALLVGPGKACNSAQELDQALTELEDRGLIGWDREGNRYDAHPIVRGVVWQLTDRKDQRAVYTALEAHFEPMVTPGWQEVETLADLTPAIERYHTLTGLARYDDAFEIFRHRLSVATLYRFAAHRERISWLEQLFPNGVPGLPSLADEGRQSEALHMLALSYKYSGQPGIAVPLFKKSCEIDERRGDDDGRQTSLEDLSEALGEIGNIFHASLTARQALVLARKLNDICDEATSLLHAGKAFNVAGKHTPGCLAVERSRSIWVRQGGKSLEGIAAAFRAECSLWLADFAKANRWAEVAADIAASERNERDLIRATLLQGKVALGFTNLPLAEELLHRALTRARAVNAVGFELAALVALAELELRRGHHAEATARLNDIWEAAERGPYPLQQADAYNVLSYIALAEGNRTAALEAATKAYKAAWCDGPPYAYHWGLQKAKAHLAALAAPEPDMPPFDESKFEPLPEVEINPKDEYWVDPEKLD